MKDENKIIREEVEAFKKEISNRTEEFNTKLIEKDREIKECQDEIAAFKEQNRKLIENNCRNQEKIENEKVDLVEANKNNMDKKDEVIESIEKENERLRDEEVKVGHKNKQIKADYAAKELLLEEINEKLEKGRNENEVLKKQIKTMKEKEIKILQNDVQKFKTKVEEQEALNQENRQTINQLNDYLKEIKETNKRLVINNRYSQHNDQSSRSHAVEHDARQDNTIQGDRIDESKIVKIYIGNIDEEATEADVKNTLRIPEENEKVTLHKKERKHTRVQCRYGPDCRFKHLCKFQHNEHLEESTKYAIIEVDESLKEDILSHDGQALYENKLIIEECHRPEENKTLRKVCKFYMQSNCTNGKDCGYAHPMECRNYKRTGTCNYGKNCKYLHRQNNEKNNQKTQNLCNMEGIVRYILECLPQMNSVPHVNTWNQQGIPPLMR